MVTKKDRRHSGRVIDTTYTEEESPYAAQYWDEWVDYRDGYRHSKDRTLIKTEYINCWACSERAKKDNLKLKALAKRRKAKKLGGIRKALEYYCENCYMHIKGKRFEDKIGGIFCSKKCLNEFKDNMEENRKIMGELQDRIEGNKRE